MDSAGLPVAEPNMDGKAELSAGLLPPKLKVEVVGAPDCVALLPVPDCCWFPNPEKGDGADGWALLLVLVLPKIFGAGLAGALPAAGCPNGLGEALLLICDGCV